MDRYFSTALGGENGEDEGVVSPDAVGDRPRTRPVLRTGSVRGEGEREFPQPLSNPPPLRMSSS